MVAWWKRILLSLLSVVAAAVVCLLSVVLWSAVKSHPVSFRSSEVLLTAAVAVAFCVIAWLFSVPIVLIIKNISRLAFLVLLGPGQLRRPGVDAGSVRGHSHASLPQPEHRIGTVPKNCPFSICRQPSPASARCFIYHCCAARKRPPAARMQCALRSPEKARIPKCWVPQVSRLRPGRPPILAVAVLKACPMQISSNRLLAPKRTDDSTDAKERAEGQLCCGPRFRIPRRNN